MYAGVHTDVSDCTNLQLLTIVLPLLPARITCMYYLYVLPVRITCTYYLCVLPALCYMTTKCNYFETVDFDDTFSTVIFVVTHTH